MILYLYLKKTAVFYLGCHSWGWCVFIKTDLS